MAGNADYFNSRKPPAAPSHAFGQPSRQMGNPVTVPSSFSPKLNPIQFKGPANPQIAGPISKTTPGKPGPSGVSTSKFPAQVGGPKTNKALSGQTYPKQVNPRSAPPRAANALPNYSSGKKSKLGKVELRFRHPLGTQHNGKLHAVLREMVK